MNRTTRTMVVMCIAIFTATLASIGIYYAIQSVPVREVEVGTQLVVVAARNLSTGTRLQADHLKLEKWPSSSLVSNSFATTDALIGRGLVASLTENEPLTEKKLAPKEAGAGLSPTIPEGMRAMAVKVDDVVGVAGFVVPGTRVDLLVTLRKAGQAAGGPMSRTLLSNILVLTSGTRIDQEQGADGKSVPVSVVTVAVSPADGERVALAMAEGQISLALRNPLDDAPTETTGVGVQGLIDGNAPPPPVEKPIRVRAPRPAPEPVVEAPPPPPPPPPVYKVETIRAAKRTEEVVD